MANLDFPLSPTVGQIYNGAGASWRWDGVKWMNASTTQGQLVPEAPADGFMYERINNNWSRDPIQTDAPDASNYIRNQGAWAIAPVQTDAPDASNYVRQHGAWVADPIQTDAPSGPYAYGRTAGAWVPTVGGASVGTTPPANALTGQLWYDLNSGQTYCYVDDGNSKQWVITNNVTAAYLATCSDVPPPNPVNGQMWFDTVGAQAYVSYNDGNSTQWVVANNMAGSYLPLGGGTMVGPIVLAPGQGMFSTGDVKQTLKTVADPGWLMMDDTTFGSAASGAAHANANTQKLFNLLFANCADADVPILTSAGAATTRSAQGTAAAAWAANCQMSLPKVFGRAIAGAGAGAGLTARTLGSNVGAETHAISANEMPVHSHSVSVTINPQYNLITANPNNAGVPNPTGASGYGYYPITQFIASISASAGNAGGGAAMSLMNPMAFFNVMICL